MGNKTKTSWTKGQSGNPKGAPPKTQTMTAKAEEILSIVDVEIKRNGKRTKVSRKEAAAEILIRKALSGDVPSLRLLWGYIDGLPRQRIEMTGEGGGPVEVVFPQGFKGV